VGGKAPQTAFKRSAKGELKKQSGGLFFKRERPASEGVPLLIFKR